MAQWLQWKDRNTSCLHEVYSSMTEVDIEESWSIITINKEWSPVLACIQWAQPSLGGQKNFWLISFWPTTMTSVFLKHHLYHIIHTKKLTNPQSPVPSEYLLKVSIIWSHSTHSHMFLRTLNLSEEDFLTVPRIYHTFPSFHRSPYDVVIFVLDPHTVFPCP